MVQTSNGLKAIETFKHGDLVYSKDQFTQAPGVRPVVATKQTFDQLLYEVVVKNAKGQTETYTTTSEHPFWVTNGPANGQWLKASLLQAGLHLTNVLGETLEVVSQTALEQTATVYNIEVHEHSTYHVGEMGVWVHNAKCCEVGVITDIIDSVAVDPSSRAVFSRSKIYENGIGVKLDDTQDKLLESIADAKSLTAKEVKSVLVIDTKPLLQRGVALDRNAAGKTVQLSDDWFDEVGRRLGADSAAYKAIVEARDLGTLSKVIAVPDRANKMVNLVKVNVPNKVELELLKKKKKLTE